MDTFLQIMCVLGAVWFGFVGGATEYKDINPWALVLVMLPYPVASVALMVLAWLIGHPEALG